MSSDPIKLGLAASFNRPGGNATGVNVLTTALEPKRLGLLHDLVPTAGTIGILVNPSFPPSAGQVSDVEKAGRAIGVSVRGPTWGADDVPLSRISRGRRADQLWRRHRRGAPAGRALCR